MKESGDFSKRTEAYVVLPRPPPARPSPPWHLFFSVPASESPPDPPSSTAVLCSQLTCHGDGSPQQLPIGAGPARESSSAGPESPLDRHSAQGLPSPACCRQASSSLGGRKRMEPVPPSAEAGRLQGAFPGHAAWFPVLKGKALCPSHTPLQPRPAPCTWLNLATGLEPQLNSAGRELRGCSTLSL